MVPVRFIIHTNSRINDTIGLQDHAGVWLDIDAAGLYRCDIKRSRGDPSALVSFGPTGDNTITVLEIDSADPAYNVFLLEAPVEAVLQLDPGLAIADIVRTDGPDWQAEFPVSIIQGVTDL